MNLDQFFQEHNGKYRDFDGVYGPQCKDLFSFYNRDVVKNPNYVPGDAWELWKNAPSEYYTKQSKPKRGDVAVWYQSFGGFGHVAIVWDDNSNHFFSQNYPLNSPCALRYIPDLKIIGYLRPKHMPEMSKFENKSIINTKTGAKAFVKSGKRNMYGHVVNGTYKEPGFTSDYEHAAFSATAVFVSEADWNNIPQSNTSAHDVLHGKPVL